MVTKIAAKMSTETYLRPENSFLKLMMSMRVARLSIVTILTTHILLLYSSNDPVWALATGSLMYSLIKDSMNPQAK